MGRSNLGSYDAEQVCPAGEMITGFRVQLGNIYDQDKTGINGIQLACTDGTKTTQQNGPYGQWSSWKYCDEKEVAHTSNYVIGFNYRSMAPKGRYIDDIAGTDIKMTCNNGNILLGGGHDAGEWHRSSWGKCEQTLSPCGIQVQTESDQFTKDDTGVNHVRLICCTNPR